MTYDKTSTIFFPIKFPTLNEYTQSQRTNVYSGSGMKKKYTNMVAEWVLGNKPFNNPVDIEFVWVESDRRRDPDNIIFAKKFILDGLVKAKVLPNDTQEWIKSFKESWYVDKTHAGVYVTITEAE